MRGNARHESRGTAKNERAYRICARCIMDTSDPKITFDERGWCDYCRNYDANILPSWHTDERGDRELARIVDRIKADGRGRDHDCLIGISGGIDSSYVTYIAVAKLLPQLPGQHPAELAPRRAGGAGSSAESWTRSKPTAKAGTTTA